MKLTDILWGATLLIVAIEGEGARGGQALLVPPRSWRPIPPQGSPARTWGSNTTSCAAPPNDSSVGTESRPSPRPRP